MPRYDYPSPDTVASSDCGNGPSPDSSFEHLRKEEVEFKALYSPPGVGVPAKGAVERVDEPAEDVEAVDAQVQRAVGIVRARCEGRLEQDGWIELDFNPSQYRQFCRLESENIDNARHNYDPYRCILAFRGSRFAPDYEKSSLRKKRRKEEAEKGF
jgi:hypothetical protein